jgi:hypothetical protein
MKDEIQNYMDRPKRYDNIDGTGEMGMGLMMLAFALSGCLNAILPDNHWWNTIGGVLVMYAVLIPALCLGYWGGKAIKKHITWPRTGYVAYGPNRQSRWMPSATVCLGSVVIGGGLVCLMLVARRHGAISLLGIGTLAVYAATYAFWIFFMGREHSWKWGVLVFMTIGLLVIGLPVGGDYFKVWRQVALFVGLVWLGSGAATLYLYLRHTQPPAQGAE